MIDLNTSWKNDKDIFYQQLKLNLHQLNSTNFYPEHWNDFLHVLSITSINSILDLGCGCGAYYSLINKHFNHIHYTGIDYAHEAINIAKSQWSYNDFYVKDFWQLDHKFISDYDAIHASALFDVMPNGDGALNFILDLDPKIVIISRMSFTEKNSYYDTYLAYDKLHTCRYYHNINNFVNTCNNYNYKIYKYNTNFVLKHDK